MNKSIEWKDINNGLIEYKGIHFVYYLMYKDNCIYIGSSCNLYKRLKVHKFKHHFQTIKLVSFDNKVQTIKTKKEMVNMFGIVHGLMAKKIAEEEIFAIETSDHFS